MMHQLTAVDPRFLHGHNSGRIFGSAVSQYLVAFASRALGELVGQHHHGRRNALDPHLQQKVQ